MLNLEQGEICIGASDMTLKYFLLPYLERFHEALPENPRDGDKCADTGDAPAISADGRIDFGIVSIAGRERRGWLKMRSGEGDPGCFCGRQEV